MNDSAKETATSSEFDAFLATREKEASSAASSGADTSNRGSRTLQNSEEEQALFSLWNVHCTGAWLLFLYVDVVYSVMYVYLQCCWSSAGETSRPKAEFLFRITDGLPDICSGFLTQPENNDSKYFPLKSEHFGENVAKVPVHLCNTISSDKRIDNKN